MEYIILTVMALFFILLLFFVLQINVKKVKELGENEELNKLADTFPENIDICKTILKKLGNTAVTIKEDTEAKANLYLVVGDSITIANIRNTFTRVQTIAHECIHSVQSKSMLWFNFVFTNVYLLYFLVISVLTIMNIIPNPMIYLAILILLGSIQYFIRSMLETEAMLKARYVAKEYLEENSICSKAECDKIVNQYDKLNTIGIRFVNFDIMMRNLIKVMIYAVICFVF